MCEGGTREEPVRPDHWGAVTDLICHDKGAQSAFWCRIRGVRHLVEHHTTPLCIAPSPGIFLSAIPQRTSRIRIGPLERLGDYDSLIEDETFIIEAPQRVADLIVRTVRTVRCGINYSNSLFAFGDLSHQEAMKSVDLFAQEVMPAFR